MQNKKLIILIVVGVMAIFSLIYGIVTPSKVRRELSSNSAGVRQDKRVSPSRETISKMRQAKRTSYVSWGRNPFLILEGTVRGVILTGIIWDKERPMAMINNNILGIGDKCEVYTIVEITQDSAILEQDGERYTLELHLPL